MDVPGFAPRDTLLRAPKGRYVIDCTIHGGQAPLLHFARSDHFLKAEALIAAIGYHRRDAELESLREALGNPMPQSEPRPGYPLGPERLTTARLQLHAPLRSRLGLGCPLPTTPAPILHIIKRTVTWATLPDTRNPHQCRL